MVARSKRASLYPDDEKRIRLLEERVSDRMLSVDEFIEKAASFAEKIDRGDLAPNGFDIDELRDEDSLVIHMDSIVRSIP